MKKLKQLATTLLFVTLAGTARANHQFPLTIKPHPDVNIYLGNSSDGLFFPPTIAALQKHAFDILTTVQKKLGLERFALLKPLYRTDGRTIMANTETPPALACPGDYLVSNQPGLGLITATADCIPIIYIDPVHHAIGIAHAGWRSTAQQIATRVVHAMHEAFETDPKDLQIIFGPSIRGCCYEMQQDTFGELGVEIDGKCAHKDDEDKIFVDLSVCNQRQLIACGVQPDNIALRFNLCTKCNPPFFSYRRDGSRAGRQLSVVAITP